MSADTKPETGGYFGLELPDYGDSFSGLTGYQSARAALRAVFSTGFIKQLWLPAYVCDSVLQSAEQAGVPYTTYLLDETLYPAQVPAVLADGEVLLYVNYFGLKQDNVLRLQQSYPSGHLIIDNSHALFARPYDVLACVYSPRKFAGLPDGGWLAASEALKLVPPDVEDEGSFERLRFMMLRTAHSAREGYAAFNAARQSLQGLPPLAMSRITRRLMRSIDWVSVAAKRKAHFAILHKHLSVLNDLQWTPQEDEVPLCYPLMVPPSVNVQALRIRLAEQNIFVPVYWPDASSRLQPDNIAARLVHRTLFLPIDQRMDTQQCLDLAQTVIELMKQSDFDDGSHGF